MKNIGLCRNAENEKQVNLLENIIACVDSFFVKELEKVPQWTENGGGSADMWDKFYHTTQPEGIESALGAFQGYYIDEWESGLRRYVYDELQAEGRVDGQDPVRDIEDFLDFLGRNVDDNKKRSQNKELNLTLHYEVVTVIRFLYTGLLQARGKERTERRYVEIGYRFAHYFHYVSNYAEELAFRMLKIMEGTQGKESAGWELWKTAEMNRVMGDIQRLQGRKDKALDYYRKAEALCRIQILSVLDGKHSDKDYMESRRVEAGVLLMLDYYKKQTESEEDRQKEILDIYGSLGDDWGRAYCYQRFGEKKYDRQALVFGEYWNVCGQENLYNEIKSDYDNADSLYRAKQDETGRAYICKCIGDMVVKTRRAWSNGSSWMESAVGYYLEAFLRYCRNVNWRGLANVIQAMETCLRTITHSGDKGEDSEKNIARKNVAGMEKMYGLAEECYRWIGDLQGLADTLDYMGHGYELCDEEIYNYKALMCWTESRNLWRRQGNEIKADKAEKCINNRILKICE